MAKDIKDVEGLSAYLMAHRAVNNNYPYKYAAEQTGISAFWVHQIWRGKRVPAMDALVKIARFVGCKGEASEAVLACLFQHVRDWNTKQGVKV